MQHATIPGLNKPVSRLIQGCARLTAGTEQHDFELLDAVWEAGGDTFDTARCYYAGESEKILGRWVASRGLREKVVLITKGAHPTAEEWNRVTPQCIANDIGESLDNLQTDTIDIYFLHRDNPETPVGPVIEALNAEVEKGRIRAFGGSNWSCERLRAANDYARAHGLIPFAAGSPNFCLAERVKEPWGGCISFNLPKDREALAWYESEKLPLFAWSSLAAGFFSDRFAKDGLDSFTEYLDRVCIDAYCYDSNYERLERARDLAARKGVTIPQIALAYVLSHSVRPFALLGCQSGSEFIENAHALDIPLTADERAWLEAGE